MVWFDEMDVRPRQGAFLYGYNNEKIRIWTSAMRQPRKEIILKKGEKRERKKKTKKKKQEKYKCFCYTIIIFIFCWSISCRVQDSTRIPYGYPVIETVETETKIGTQQFSTLKHDFS